MRREAGARQPRREEAASERTTVEEALAAAMGEGASLGVAAAERKES